jgi:hypothetical protein
MFAALAGLALACGLFVAVRLEIAEIARHVNYSSIGVRTSNKETIVDLVSGIIFAAVLSVLLIVFSWTYMWQFSLVIVAGYFVAVISMMWWSYARLHSEGFDMPQKVYHFARPVVIDEAEPMPDIPKPVYGIVKAAQQDVRL